MVVTGLGEGGGHAKSDVTPPVSVGCSVQQSAAGSHRNSSLVSRSKRGRKLVLHHSSAWPRTARSTSRWLTAHTLTRRPSTVGSAVPTTTPSSARDLGDGVVERGATLGQNLGIFERRCSVERGRARLRQAQPGRAQVGEIEPPAVPQNVVPA